MKPFIACYKAFRGGEFFGASLESIVENTDGAVIVFSDEAWVRGLSLSENCSGPLADFHDRHPNYPVVALSGQWASSSEQYDAGLATIVEEFGPEAAVLVIDTDEVWDPLMLAELRNEVEHRPMVHYFRSRLYSYVRSPLYRVWPTEPTKTCVALQNALPQPTPNRFAVASPATVQLPQIAFHHFTYVRADEDDLRSKFVTTSSQEATASDPDWWDRVWPHLPGGRNLHMTPGCEAYWKEIVQLVPSMLPSIVRDLPFVADLTALEEARWRDHLRAAPPSDTLIPVPVEEDRKKYAAPLWALLGGQHFGPDFLRSRLKTTYLEALWLAHWASEIPTGGRILEIGCGSGGSTAVMATASEPSVTIETIDPFCTYNEEMHTGLVANVREGNEAEFRETARQFGYSGRLAHHQCSSLDAVGIVAASTYDLVFVDGNHSTEFVKNDLAMSWLRLKPGGLLVGHDYTTRFPGVIQAVDAIDGKCNFRTPVGTSLFYARRPI